MMHIERKRIRNLERYLSTVPIAAEFRVVSEVHDDKSLTRIGMSPTPAVGHTLLPRIVGPVTRYNAEGRWLLRKDLPKELRYVRTVRWTWTTWDGDEHEDERDIFRECFQRDLAEPPGVELTYLEQDGRRLVTSPILHHQPSEETNNLHAINVMLEAFGHCDVLVSKMGKLIEPIVKRVNWKLLPGGKYPWDKIEEHVEHSLKGVGADTREIVLNRQKALAELNPDEQWVGEGGFGDYMAYVFKSFGLVVLESLRRDNAIYVFVNDWRDVSRLTKREIIQANLHHARIVHTKGWQSRLSKLFSKRAA